MRVSEHGACGAEHERGEDVRPVLRGAVGEHEQDRRDDTEAFAEKNDPLGVDDARERACEAHGESENADGDPAGEDGSDSLQ